MSASIALLNTIESIGDNTNERVATNTIKNGDSAIAMKMQIRLLRRRGFPFTAIRP
jgi:hypothetical protein